MVAAGNDTPQGAVLVVGPAWVGDMVMAQSLFITLRQRRPAPEVDVIAPAWSLPLLERMPEVRRAIRCRWPMASWPWANAGGWGAHCASAATSRPSCCRARPRRRSRCWPPACPAYRLQGEHRYGLLNDIRPLDRKALYRTVDRFVALGHEADAPLPPPTPEPRLAVTADGRRQARSELGLAGDDAPVLALCPGAEYGPAKRWPPEYFAEVARERLAAGWQVWLFGSDKDQPITGGIAKAAPGCTDLAGRTTLAQAIDLLASAAVVVSNDSGLMHVAAATGRPVVALYGSSDPGYTPPLSAHARILYLGLDCSPCFQRECPLGHLNCLRRMQPDRVLEAITALHREAS